jgi:hypothetical protein
VLAAVDRAGVCLMVGYMKRYDLAYERLLALMPAIADLRLVRVTTLESAIDPYVAHYPLHRPRDVSSEQLALLEADDRERIFTAIGMRQGTRGGIGRTGSCFSTAWSTSSSLSGDCWASRQNFASQAPRRHPVPWPRFSPSARPSACSRGLICRAWPITSRKFRYLLRISGSG